MFDGGDSGKKNDGVGTSGDGRGSVGFCSGDSGSANSQDAERDSGSGRNDVGEKVGEAGQNGSRLTSGCESTGVGNVDAEDEVEADSVNNGDGYVPDRLVLREASDKESMDAEGVRSCGESKLGSASIVGVEGAVSRFPKDPARPREMKLKRRLRFWAFMGGEGGVEGPDKAGRPASGSTESIDHLDVETPSSKAMGGRRTDEVARGDDIEGARDTTDGLWTTVRVEYMLIGEAGVFANSASVLNCGEEVDVDRLSVGRGVFFRSLLKVLRASILCFRTGGLVMTGTP
jgi:hypothetical protein